MNIAAEISPWLTICSTAPLKPATLVANRPKVISPSCAMLE